MIRLMSFRIEDRTRKLFKVVASIEGKSMSKVLIELIEEYINKNREKIIELSEKENLHGLMKMSQASFMEWDNKEDEIYNDL